MVSEREAVVAWCNAKLSQLYEYMEPLERRDDIVSQHALAVAQGRADQLCQLLAVIERGDHLTADKQESE